MKKFKVSSFGVIFAIMLLTPVFAFSTPLSFNWMFSGPDLSGSGTLTAVPDPSLPGVDDIIGGTGTLTAFGPEVFNVTIAPCSNYAATCTFVNTDGHGANLQVDNLLWPGNAPGSQLDGFGIAFITGPPGSGASYIGVQDSPSIYFYNYGDHGEEYLTTPFTVTSRGDAPASTPEPSSVLLLGSGVFGLGFYLKKKVRA